jgi:flagellar basal-body rod protein FlgF
MAGAKATLQRQDSLANNLANASTTGFRAEMQAFRAVPVRGEGATTRAYVLESTIGHDSRPGAMQATGRSLDVAAQGNAWFAVQSLDGTEAYTRAGNLQLSAEGTLVLPSGTPVLGDGGPITVPQDSQLSVAPDGTVSAKQAGQTAVNQIGRIKLVNPEDTDLVKGLDGLFRTKSGEQVEADPNVRLAEGTLEGSNVSVVDTMIGMIAAARQFEMQMKLMQSAEQNEQKASSLISNM